MGYVATKKDWTETDEFILDILSAERFTGRAMASLLGRSVGAIYSKRAKMGLRPLWDERNDTGKARQVVKHNRPKLSIQRMKVG